MKKKPDPNQVVDDLIRQMDESIKEFSSGNMAKNTRLLVENMARLATILNVLSRESQKSTTSIIRLTWALFGLTLVIVLIEVLHAFPHFGN